MTIFTGKPRSANIVDIRYNVLAKLSKKVFEKIIIDHPAFVWMKYILERNLSRMLKFTLYFSKIIIFLLFLG
ncbi:hypothetical protein FHS57_006373 [Runella defluvii]|uniref:Cyclic nucleotide-binding domain-containing protein n=1 Tax=Runella defluvii TaxID=370973 RepID=A0A7W6EU89_9BACT|nr:hypothetical protein [Runella defluvii]